MAPQPKAGSSAGGQLQGQESQPEELQQQQQREEMPGDCQQRAHPQGDSQHRALSSAESQHQDRPSDVPQGRALQPDGIQREDQARYGQHGPQNEGDHVGHGREGKRRHQAGARGSGDGEPAGLTVQNDGSISGGGA